MDALVVLFELCGIPLQILAITPEAYLYGDANAIFANPEMVSMIKEAMDSGADVSVTKLEDLTGMQCS